MQRRERVIVWATAAVLLGYLAVFAVLNLRDLPGFTDGDIYADMELAREMWRQKTLFPSNWIFGNQYYVIATPVAAALFYGLTGSMNLSMALATELMGLLLLASLVWLLRPVLPSRTLRLLALLLFTAAPMGTRLLLEPEGQLFFVLASYYACYLITFFFVLGDYTRALEQPERSRPWALLLSLGLSLACGMQSLRQTAVMILPLLGYEGLAFLWRLLTRKEAFPAARRKALLRVALYTAANLLGLGIMRVLNVPSRSIYRDIAAGSAGLSARLHDLWAAWRGISGLDAALYGEAPVFFGLFFAVQLLAVLGAIVLLLRRRRVDALVRLWLLCGLSLAGTALAGLVTSVQMREIYLFVWYVLVTFSLLLLLRENMARLLPAALVLLCLGNLVFSYGSTLRFARSQDFSEQRRFCRDALDAGIEYVYGDWSFLPGFLVWSDGALTGGFSEGEGFVVRGSINLQDIYSEADNARALYLFNPWSKTFLPVYAEQCGFPVELFGEYGDCAVYRAERQIMAMEERKFDFEG